MKKVNLILVMLLSISFAINGYTQQWVQFGSNLNGTSNNDEFGSDVCISNDGFIVASSSYKSYSGRGTIQVFERGENDWIQRGSDIHSPNIYDNMGKSIALNSEGTILAIGAPSAKNNGVKYGKTIVYIWQNEDWVQLGNEIFGDVSNGSFGTKVCLSDDGLTLAAMYGAYGNPKVDVYRFQNGYWIQKGESILGEFNLNTALSIDMSSDGTFVAVGIQTEYYEQNMVKVFEYNDSWEQIGSDILSESAHDLFGSSIDISNGGLRLAVGAPKAIVNIEETGKVQTYLYTNNEWITYGNTLVGEFQYDRFGSSVSFNDEGDKLAIGVKCNDGYQLKSELVKVNRDEFGNILGFQGELKNSSKVKQLYGKSYSELYMLLTSSKSNNNLQLKNNVINVYHDEYGNIIGYERELESVRFGKKHQNQDKEIIVFEIISKGEKSTNVGQVKVFEDNYGTWNPIGQAIIGNSPYDNFGYSVALSSNGNHLVVGAIEEYGNDNNPGYASAFELLSIPQIVVDVTNLTNQCLYVEVMFTVSGLNVDSFQWQKYEINGVWSDLANDDVFSGVTTDELHVYTNQSLDNTLYRCVLSNEEGSVISSVGSLSYEEEVPVFDSIANQEVQADEDGIYVVIGDQFDPQNYHDNCGEVFTINDYNNSESLDGALFPIGNTTVTWMLTDEIGNYTTQSFEVVVSPYVTVEEQEITDISIFPNPNKGVLRIESENCTIKEVIISDFNGRIVFRKYGSYQREDLNISHLMDGIYILTVHTDKEIFNRRIVKH